MKPAGSFGTKYLFPIDFPGLQLRRCCVPAVGAAQRRSHAKTTFSKVQTVADRPSNAVVLHPANVGLLNAPLVNQILNQAAHWIVSKCCYNSSFQAKAALQPSSHVVLSPTFPTLKSSRGCNPSIPRIEPQHHLSQADQVPSAVGFRFDI